MTYTNKPNIIRILILFLPFFITSCKSIEKNENHISIELPNEMSNLLTEETTNISEKNYKLIYYVEDGECVGCIAELKEWFDLFEKNSLNSKDLSIYFIFKECEKIELEVQLNAAQVNKYTYWDKNNIIGRQIDSLFLERILLLDLNNELVFNINIRNEDKDEQINVIWKLLNVS